MSRIIWAAFVVSMVAFGLSAIVFATRPAPPPAAPLPPPSLCQYASPRVVLPTVVRSGDLITEKRATCVANSQVSVNVTAYRSFINNETGENIPSLNRKGETQPRLPGDVISEVQIRLANVETGDPLAAGSYHLEGLDRLPSTGEIRLWSSIDFQVIQ